MAACPAASTRRSLILALLVPLGSNACSRAGGEALPPDVEWKAHAGDAGGRRWSDLHAIDTSNVDRLEVAWSVRAGDLPPEMFDRGSHGADGIRPDGEPAAASAGAGCSGCHGQDIRFETTPLMRRSTLYVSTPLNRVLALDPATGAERWAFDPHVDVDHGYSEDFISRGVSAWDDPAADASTPCGRRIFIATIEAELIALDADRGETCAAFGQDGRVDLSTDVALGGRAVDVGDYLVTSPPAVVGDVLVVGSAIGDNRRKDVESGIVRAYDVRSGSLLWSFDPIPRSPDAPGWSGWSEEAARTTGGANVWAPISADLERGLVFLPTGSAAPDFYGGERPGRNDFANSVVAVRATTGEVVWSFQVVHHDLWDYDVASQPIVLDVERGGRTLPAVLVGTKMGHLFLLDRETGAPLDPVEERAVPASDVPGERAWPTQPFPSLPALHETVLTPDSAFGLTDEERAFCSGWIARLRNDGIFTPPSLEGSLLWPGFGGGMNWDGAAWDPVRQTLIVPVKRLAMFVQLHRRNDFERGLRDRAPGLEYASQGGTPYGMTRMPLVAPSGLPCSPPPWSKLVAVDLSTGTLRWERPHGGVPERLLPQGVTASPEWGSLTFGGPLATGGGLTFIAGGMDDRIRAYATSTGALLWEAPLPAGGQAAPMTYRHNGRQYVVIAAGGRSGIGSPGDWIVAFALPE
ncbi:MAG: pyrroloquinoline quinone-dependent dehydrogenase [Gemmatimonadota bacterium]